MKVFEGDHDTWTVEGPTALTIGVYDGIHIGHQAVIRRLAERADGLPVAILTFDGHPLAVSAPDHAPQLITSRDQKLSLLESLGVDIVAMLRFSMALRKMAPEQFVEEFIVGLMHARKVVVGRDFRFGFERAGDVDLLERLAAEHGYDVEAVELLGGDVPVSSTAVRQLLDAGDVEGASRLLGRPFELRGIVAHGDGRGHSIGYPTANLAIPPAQVHPRQGVYAGRVARVGSDEFRPCVVNVGVRPTFGGKREVVEIHVLDYDEDLYGVELALRFVARIRGERRFTSPDELVEQIGRDVEHSRGLLGA